MEGINLYSIDYYKKTVFKGSYRGLCFRIFRAEANPLEGFADIAGEEVPDDLAVSAVGEGGEFSGGEAPPVEVLRVQAWKGPYVLEKTHEEIFTEDFEYTDAGLNSANEWLEKKQQEVLGND
ncbi:MAG: hypothetical protein J5819_07975 [Eubacterium sp.]|nr:hypothetical protein [Eubacterium sp.]